MAFIRSMSDISKKWAEVTPLRSGDYESGVRNPRRDWAQATSAAQDSWKAGVANAAAKGFFSKGVNFAGTPKWQNGAVTKGVARWGPGVTIAEPDYARGFAPYRDAIERVTLPPRYAKRDPRNMNRVKAVVDAMISTKEGRGPGVSARGGGV